MKRLYEKIETISIKITPAMITLLLLLFSCVPIPLAGIKQIMPEFSYICIYYCGLFYPASLPYIFLFAFGITQDSLNDTPLGMSSFINICLAFLAAYKRKIIDKNSFIAIWSGFCLVAAVGFVLEWLLSSLYYGRFLAADAAFIRFIATFFAYPLLHALFDYIGRLINE